MTAEEMKFEFLLKADEVGALNNKSFLDNEIDWLLHDAELELIRTRLNPNNPRGMGVEEDQKRIEDMKTIIIRYPEQSEIPLIYHENEHIYELDLSRLRYKYYYFLSGAVNQVKNNCAYTARIRRIMSHNFEDALADPFNNSSLEEVLVNFGRSSSGTSSSIYFYPAPNHFLTTARVSYLKEPRRIHQGTYENYDGVNPGMIDSELPDIVHPEIVNIAVLKAADIMKDPSLQQSFRNTILTHE